MTLAAKNMHVYEVHPRKDKRGVDLISDMLPFWSAVMRRPMVSNAIDYAKFHSRSDKAVI